jgi:hypothetical protein
MNKEKFWNTITGIEFDSTGKITALKGMCKAGDFKRKC